MSKFFMKKLMNIFLIVVLLLPVFMSVPNQVHAYELDEFDLLREKVKLMLTGGSGDHVLDPDLSQIVLKITDKGQSAWKSMDTSLERTYLWEDIGPNRVSDNLTSNYNRLRDMALAYSTSGSTLYNNVDLKNDIIAALEWMYTTGYNMTIELPGNWWHREIGGPLALNDIVIMLFDELTSEQVSRFMAPVAKYVPVVKDNGANRVWFAIITAYYGVIVKDEAKLAAARDGLSPIFDYVTSGDGFYRDGSFIQHGAYAYTGGYGQDLVQDLTSLMYLLSGSSWDITDPDKQNVFQWIYDSYAPLMYKGAMMDMSRGRVISRQNYQDHVVGHVIVSTVTKLSEFAPAADAAAYKRMVKDWIQSDTYLNFYTNASLYTAVLAKEIMNNTDIKPDAGTVGYKQFPNMDRAVHFGPDYAFALGMHSSRIYNYESINNENVKGWHTGDGMTYLYNNDTAQFSDDYWPTIDSYRLPGTTVVKESTVPPGKKSDQAWVGGTDLGGFGVSGMALHTTSFPASTGNFTVVSGGTWAVDGGQYVLTNPASGTLNGNVSVHRTEVPGDFILTVDAAVTPTTSEWNDFSILFNYQDALNYYFVSLNESNDEGTSGIFKVVDGIKKEIADIDSPIAAGTMYKVKIEKSGSNITVYLNDTLVARASDSTFTTGKIGLGTMNDGAVFDNVTVINDTVHIEETFTDNGQSSMQDLQANKSWFMFDDEIVALGAGISSEGSEPIETIIENRKINGNNALTINNEAVPASLGWSDSVSQVQWIHLEGNDAESDIGYYFPETSQVNGLREARTDRWRSINGAESQDPITRNYMTLWFDHGLNPSNSSYSYVLLPNKTSSEVNTYAQANDITILENSQEAQVVKENNLNIIGANFWKDEVKKVGFIQSNKKASVMTKETDKEIEISISDPTHLNTGTIEIELDRSASYTISNDPTVEVTQLSPTIKLSIHTRGMQGAASKVKLSYEDYIPEEVTGVMLDKSELDLYINETAILTATVLPTSAKNKSVQWSTSNPEVATVMNGIIKPLKAGSTIITVTTMDGRYSATCQVNVLEKNFALNKNVTESRRSSAPGDAALLPSNVVDGRNDTRWASYRGDNEWIYVDLGKEHVINHVVLNWEFSHGKEYRIEVSNDPQGEWQTVYSTDNGKGGTENIQFDNVTTRYVRMYGIKRSNNYSFSLWELEVYGPENVIIEINPLDDIAVFEGSDPNAVGLPTEVVTVLNNGKSVPAAVYWDMSTLELNKAGSYELLGIVENTDIKAKVRVNVIDNTPPAAPVIASPTKPTNMADKPSVSVYAEAGSIITILENGTLVATAIGAGSTAVEISLDTLTHGPHDLQAIVTDDAGNESELVNIPKIIVVKPPGRTSEGL